MLAVHFAKLLRNNEFPERRVKADVMAAIFQTFTTPAQLSSNIPQETLEMVSASQVNVEEEEELMDEEGS